MIYLCKNLLKNLIPLKLYTNHHNPTLEHHWQDLTIAGKQTNNVIFKIHSRQIVYGKPIRLFCTGAHQILVTALVIEEINECRLSAVI